MSHMNFFKTLLLLNLDHISFRVCDCQKVLNSNNALRLQHGLLRSSMISWVLANAIRIVNMRHSFGQGLSEWFQDWDITLLQILLCVFDIRNNISWMIPTWLNVLGRSVDGREWSSDTVNSMSSRSSHRLFLFLASSSPVWYPELIRPPCAYPMYIQVGEFFGQTCDISWSEWGILSYSYLTVVPVATTSF